MGVDVWVVLFFILHPVSSTLAGPYRLVSRVLADHPSRPELHALAEQVLPTRPQPSANGATKIAISCRRV